MGRGKVWQSKEFQFQVLQSNDLTARAVFPIEFIIVFIKVFIFLE